MLAEKKIFLFSKTSREALGAHPHSHPIAVGFLLQGRSRQGVMLTTHLHTVLWVRMSGVIPLIPLNAVMMSTWTTDTERVLVLGL